MCLCHARHQSRVFSQTKLHMSTGIRPPPISLGVGAPIKMKKSIPSLFCSLPRKHNDNPAKHEPHQLDLPRLLVRPPPSIESASARPTPPIRPSILVNNQSQTDAFSPGSFGRIKFCYVFCTLEAIHLGPGNIGSFFSSMRSLSLFFSALFGVAIHTFHHSFCQALSAFFPLYFLPGPASQGCP